MLPRVAWLPPPGEIVAFVIVTVDAPPPPASLSARMESAVITPSTLRPASVLRSANGSSHVIDGSGFRIGREKRCDLVIPDASVSRLQAEISCGGGNYVIRDLGRVSILVNGEKLKEPHFC